MFKTRLIYSCDVLRERQRRDALVMIVATALATVFVVADVIAVVRGARATSFVFLGLAALLVGIVTWRIGVGIARYRVHYAAVHTDVDADADDDSHDATDAGR